LWHTVEISIPGVGDDVIIDEAVGTGTDEDVVTVEINIHDMCAHCNKLLHNRIMSSDNQFFFKTKTYSIILLHKLT